MRVDQEAGLSKRSVEDQSVLEKRIGFRDSLFSIIFLYLQNILI